MKSSEWFLAIWGFIWIVGTSVDFAFSFGDKNSIVIESKQPEKKQEIKTDDSPKATW